MTQRFRTLLMIFSAVLGLLGGTARGAPAVAPVESNAEKPLVLLISIDGFKPSYLSKSSAPNLFDLASRGMMAEGLISSFPSVTFPNHVTLVTGQTPDHHGIVNNTMTDPGTTQRFTLGSREAVENPFWWQESRPIWIALRKQGKVASTLFWPGSETSIDGLRPNDWLRYDHDMPHETRVKTLVGWLSRTSAERPDFATLYFADVDSAGHSAGPDSQAVRDSVKKVDESIGELSKELKRLGLLEQTTWIIVSDHGMASSPVDKVVSAQGLLANFPAARWEWLGALAGVRLNGASAEGVMQALSTLPHVACWPKADLPKRYRFGAHRRIPEIVCMAEVGYSLTDNPTRKGPLGQHGYDPEDPSMHGLLIVAGHRVQSGRLGLVNNLEIYGLMCRLLGITPERNDGEDTLHQQVIKN